MKSSTEGGVCSWTIVRPQFLHFGQITLIINHSFKAANHTKRHFHSNSARPYIQQCGVQFFMNRGYITCIAEPHTILHICVFLFSILGNAVNTKRGNSLRYMIKTKYQKFKSIPQVNWDQGWLCGMVFKDFKCTKSQKQNTKCRNTEIQIAKKKNTQAQWLGAAKHTVVRDAWCQVHSLTSRQHDLYHGSSLSISDHYHYPNQQLNYLISLTKYGHGTTIISVFYLRFF